MTRIANPVASPVVPRMNQSGWAARWWRISCRRRGPDNAGKTWRNLASSTGTSPQLPRRLAGERPAQRGYAYRRVPGSAPGELRATPPGNTIALTIGSPVLIRAFPGSRRHPWFQGARSRAPPVGCPHSEINAPPQSRDMRRPDGRARCLASPPPVSSPRHGRPPAGSVPAGAYRCPLRWVPIDRGCGRVGRGAGPDAGAGRHRRGA